MEKDQSSFQAGFVSADKLLTPKKSDVYGLVISRENNPYLINFWARVLISDKKTVKELLELSQIVMKVDFPEERVLMKQGEPLNKRDLVLGRCDLKQGTILQDEINDINFRVEKIFYLDKMSNVKVLQAKEVPVCLGAAFFKEDGELIEGNKERLDGINREILKKF